MKKLRKMMSKILAFSLVFLLCANSYAYAYNDTKGHWAERDINKWTDYGIINGYNNYFNPDDYITRAQFASILTKVMGYEYKAIGFSFA